MSYRDFDRGIPPDEIQRRKQDERKLNQTSREFQRWSGSPHVVALLRSLKAARDRIGELELEVWREATGQKTLPPRFY